MRPQASVQPVAASPSRVTVDRVVCHGVEAVRPSAVASSSDSEVAAPTGSSRSPASSTVAARVPAAPPTCTGRTSAEVASYASRTPVSQPAAFRPNVVGTACWVRVRATIGVRRWRSTSSTRSGDLLARAVGDHASNGVAGAQHQGGVDDVLAGESAVQPPRRRRRSGPASASAQHARPGRRPGCRRASASLSSHSRWKGSTSRLEVELGHAGRRDSRRRRARRATPPRRRPSPRGRPRRRTGRRRARRRARGGCSSRQSCVPEWERNTVSPSPWSSACRRMSNTKPWSSASATNVARRSSGSEASSRSWGWPGR